jgi:hypothetical protein
MPRCITDQHSLAGADDQRSNHKDRRGPGPVQCLVRRQFISPESSEKFPDVADEEVGRFHGGEVAAAVEV